MEGKAHLDHFKVGSLPTVIYIPNFITESEQIQLLNNVIVSQVNASFSFGSPNPHYYYLFIFLNSCDNNLILAFRFMMLLCQSGKF